MKTKFKPNKKEAETVLKTVVWSDGWNKGYQKAIDDFVKKCDEYGIFKINFFYEGLIRQIAKELKDGN